MSARMSGVSLRGVPEERLKGVEKKFSKLAETLKAGDKAGEKLSPVLKKVRECVPAREDGAVALVAFAENVERLRAAQEGPAEGAGDIEEYKAFITWAIRECRSPEAHDRPISGWERLEGIFRRAAEAEGGGGARAGDGDSYPKANGSGEEYGGPGPGADPKEDETPWKEPEPPSEPEVPPAPEYRGGGGSPDEAGGRREEKPPQAFAPRAVHRDEWRVDVEWTWGAGMASVLLLWRGDRTPVSAEDSKAHRETVARKAGELSGSFSLSPCGETTWHFVAYGMGADGMALGNGAAFHSTGPADRWEIVYELQKPMAWFRRTKNIVTVKIRGKGRGLRGLPPLVLVKKSGGMPLHREDGTVVLTMPALRQLTEEVSIAVSPADAGCYLGLFLDHPVPELVERVDGPYPTGGNRI